MSEYKGKKIERGSSRGRSSKVFKAPTPDKLPSESEAEQAKQQQDMKEGNYLKIVDYSKTPKEEAFDKAVDSVSPEGKYQKPPLENLREGVRVKNRDALAIIGATAAAINQLLIRPLLPGVY